jgi:glutathione S-transferase
MSELPVLWHIEISHYNEKARWALDYKGIPHVRKAPMPGAHNLYSAWLTRGGVRTFPVLQLDGKAIGDSTAIIAALEERQPEPALYPADPAERAQALALEEYFDTEVGPNVRRLAFFHLLQDRDRAVGGINPSGGARARMMRASFPIVKAVMRREYGISAEQAVSAREKIDAALDRVVDETGPSGYLVGDRFSVADLTACSLLGPILAPPQYANAVLDVPPVLDELRETMRAHPAGAWVFDVYDRHRGASAAVVAA